MQLRAWLHWRHTLRHSQSRRWLRDTHLLYANQNFPKRVIVSSAAHSAAGVSTGLLPAEEPVSKGGRQRTVVDDVPSLRDEAAGRCGKCVVAGARRPEGVAVQLGKPELRLQVVRRQRRQRAAQAVACTQPITWCYSSRSPTRV